MSGVLEVSTGTFTTQDCCKTKGTAKGLLQPGEYVSINGSTDLSQCLVGPDGACVYWIMVQKQAGIYEYKVTVQAQGPKGAGSGYLHLTFTDQEPDTYKLKIFSSTKETHEVRYNSKKPDITTITWE